MLRVIPFVIAISLFASGAGADGPRPLANALEAARAGNWENAERLAARAGGVAGDIVEWQRLRAGQGDLAEVRGFLQRRSDWPGLKLLRKRSEGMLEGASPAEVLAFFQDEAAQTGAGVLAHAEALATTGSRGDAEAELVLAWRVMALEPGEQDAFLARHGALLAPHHAARLDMALWRGWASNVARMLPLVTDGQRRLAAARLGLAADRDGVDQLIEAVPEALRGDAGLAYARFEWRLRKGRTDDAVALMLERSATPELLGEPERWAGWRRYLARDRMRDGKAQEAYRLAAHHGLQEGSSYADLEWLSGYLALRFLNDPALALDHFQRFRAAVETPISLGRAGYWIGRAQEALGDGEAAKLAYAEGAQYQTSFYGLLAAERGGVAFDTTLAGEEAFPGWRQAAFTKSSVFEAGILLINAGQIALAEQFLTHLAEGLDRAELGQMGEMAIELDQPHLAVMIGKEAAKKGITLSRPYYALHPMRKLTLPVPMELALSIARRESEFDAGVVSGAGAQGLMQLMPGTSTLVAKRLGLEHEPGKVLSDWSYNAVLGSAYLAGLAEDFGGNVVLVAAGYNAGPGRPTRWMQERGDPRVGGVDVVDWIEEIPFRETQNYVMRVAESLPIYRARLGRDPLPVPFSAELSGRTLLAD
ncbi:lytic transglycosylase domain-containing protein [Thalassovita taeanensis]|uniref:Soluble lytic murein transglycosylase n=1 Tax=Thalassovita taeanensis TaxID=657014 RepID=A0A1H9C9J6_9RHOB|nr:lytic transglycosylase domain-containing protein [Thalassovita taeanensis]SEP97368.1 soluble lytic murein transglycosylase [Thalassovita taeanensis]